MGKKYIIELEETPFIQHFKNGAWETIYRVKGFNSLVFDWNGLNMLTPYTEPDMEQVRKKEYQQGLSDAWEAARKIQDTGGNLNWWIHNISATEAIEKIRAYEQEKEEIQVGDEVEAAFGKATVTEIKEKHVYYFYADGSYGFDEKEHVTKTGRRFPEIVEVLQKMKEEA